MTHKWINHCSGPFLAPGFTCHVVPTERSWFAMRARDDKCTIPRLNSYIAATLQSFVRTSRLHVLLPPSWSQLELEAVIKYRHPLIPAPWLHVIRASPRPVSEIRPHTAAGLTSVATLNNTGPRVSLGAISLVVLVHFCVENT